MNTDKRKGDKQEMKQVYVIEYGNKTEEVHVVFHSFIEAYWALQEIYKSPKVEWIRFYPTTK